VTAAFGLFILRAPAGQWQVALILLNDAPGERVNLRGLAFVKGAFADQLIKLCAGRAGAGKEPARDGQRDFIERAKRDEAGDKQLEGRQVRAGQETDLLPSASSISSSVR
jgi:hypothetical protein